MRNERKLRHSPQMYIYQMYNVQGIFPSNFYSVRSLLARLINSQIYGLNKYERLHRFMVIMIDNDLIKTINSTANGSTMTLGMSLEWLIKEYEKAVDRKKNMMREIKPGSVNPGEPKFIWVKGIFRPLGHNFHVARDKFNEVLQDILATRRDSYFLDPSKYLDDSNYSRLGDLSMTGKEHYWRCMDEMIKKFDKQEISLRPITSHCKNRDIKK